MVSVPLLHRPFARGRCICGQDPCPKLYQMQIAPKIQRKVKREFFGPSTSIFVGRMSYPNIYVGPMGAIQLIDSIDSPNKWFGINYTKIIEFRSFLLRSKYRENIFSKSSFVQYNQELALSVKPTDVEMSFTKKPVYHLSLSDMVPPMGPTAPLKRLKVVSNPKIPRKIDRIVSDDLKAVEQVNLLYESGYDVYKISTILSSGALGMKRTKKLVPTRWSITAIDDTVTKTLLKDVRLFPELSEIQVFENEYLGNHFVILFIPGKWEYENFEAWSPGSYWAKELKPAEILEEHEPFFGRTRYADKEGGGYYAARMAVAEYLHKTRRQARVVVFREVSEDYTIPVGVWLIRETVRKAFSNPKQKFENVKSALTYVDSRLRLPLSAFQSKSKILRQKRLIDFSP